MGLQESAGLDCKRLCVQCYGCWTYLLGHREALKNLSAFKKKKNLWNQAEAGSRWRRGIPVVQGTDSKELNKINGNKIERRGQVWEIDGKKNKQSLVQKWDRGKHQEDHGFAWVNAQRESHNWLTANTKSRFQEAKERQRAVLPTLSLRRGWNISGKVQQEGGYRATWRKGRGLEEWLQR